MEATNTMKETIEIRGEPYDCSAVVCGRYNIHTTTAWRWRKRGLLPLGVRIGNVYYYPRAEVERRMCRGE